MTGNPSSNTEIIQLGKYSTFDSVLVRQSVTNIYQLKNVIILAIVSALLFIPGLASEAQASTTGNEMKFWETLANIEYHRTNPCTKSPAGTKQDMTRWSQPIQGLTPMSPEKEHLSSCRHHGCSPIPRGAMA